MAMTGTMQQWLQWLQLWQQWQCNHNHNNNTTTTTQQQQHNNNDVTTMAATTWQQWLRWYDNNDNCNKTMTATTMTTTTTTTTIMTTTATTMTTMCYAPRGCKGQTLAGLCSCSKESCILLMCPALVPMVIRYCQRLWFPSSHIHWEHQQNQNFLIATHSICQHP